MAFRLLEPSRHDVYPFIDPRNGLKAAAVGKSIMVTGAGTGIGRGIAQAFALAGAAQLILVARRSGPLEETKASIATLAPECSVSVVGDTDISNLESVSKLFQAPSSACDVLVSNASVAAQWENVAESDPVQWCKNIEINLNGTYFMARTYIEALKRAGKSVGRIINVSSASSWRYIPGLSSYAASKAGANLLSEYIDREGQAAGSRIRCVAMHPGGVNTDLGGQDKPEYIQKLLIDKPALPGATAVYLSTSRSDFLMGRFVSATWDMEELEKHEERIEKDENMLMERVIGVL